MLVEMLEVQQQQLAHGRHCEEPHTVHPVGPRDGAYEPGLGGRLSPDPMGVGQPQPHGPLLLKSLLVRYGHSQARVRSVSPCAGVPGWLAGVVAMRDTPSTALAECGWGSDCCACSRCLSRTDSAPAQRALPALPMDEDAAAAKLQSIKRGQYARGSGSEPTTNAAAGLQESSLCSARPLLCTCTCARADAAHVAACCLLSAAGRPVRRCSR